MKKVFNVVVNNVDDYTSTVTVKTYTTHELAKQEFEDRKIWALEAFTEAFDDDFITEDDSETFRVLEDGYMGRNCIEIQLIETEVDTADKYKKAETFLLKRKDGSFARWEKDGTLYFGAYSTLFCDKQSDEVLMPVLHAPEEIQTEYEQIIDKQK